MSFHVLSKEKMNVNILSVFVGEYPYGIIKDRFKGKCIE